MFYFAFANFNANFSHCLVSEDKTDTLVEQIDKKKRSQLGPIVNPFRYDSSDEEDEIKDTTQQQKNQNEGKSTKAHSENRRNFWIEPFFFVDDDYRLQGNIESLKYIK